MSNSDALVYLQRGYVVPLAAYRLALRCEELGIRLSIASGEKLAADGPHTPDILEQLRILKPHILAILRYVPSDVHLRDDSAPRPEFGPVVYRETEKSKC